MRAKAVPCPESVPYRQKNGRVRLRERKRSGVIETRGAHLHSFNYRRAEKMTTSTVLSVVSTRFLHTGRNHRLPYHFGSLRSATLLGDDLPTSIAFFTDVL